MGGSAWSDAHYDDRVSMRVATGAKAFAYDHDIKSGTVAAKVHKTLDPNGVKVRESRDSDIHPEAVPIAVLCDVTGSMGTVPQIVQSNLKKLMGLLIRRGYVDHPAILVGAIGDATCDNAPLQVGQFESGIEIEDCLTNLWLEGGGGGQTTESYELAMYFMARHTVHDHWEKRGRKGYLFIVGDEMPYARVKRDEVSRVIGATLQEDILTKAILDELRERYEVFYVLPRLTSYFENPKIRAAWRDLVGQNLLLLEDPAGICELIATQVGLCEGKTDEAGVMGDLVAEGTDHALAASVSRVLVPAGAGTGIVQAIPSSGKPSGLAAF